jgi:hypothetical protein
MASKKNLSAENLQALGVARLAELLIEMSTGNAAAKRRLRLALAGAQSSGELAQEIRKRLTTIARSRSFVDWQIRRALVEDLETQRRAIVDQVAKADPVEGLELMWRFVGLASSVFERCDDSSGTVIGIFHSACNDLGEIAKVARTDTTKLADKVFQALNENHYGQHDGLIGALSPALGQEGLEHLKRRMVEFAQEPLPKLGSGERQVIGWSAGGPMYVDDHAERWRDSMVRLALEEIADAQGDVDAFIAQQTNKAKMVPKVAAEIAQRLLAAGRAEEALNAIDAIDEDRPGWIPLEWEQTRIEALEALGRTDQAQAFRWDCFQRKLEPTHLRAYLKRLPDFDDVEAEERALSFALTYPSVHQALVLLVSWPALDKAAALVLRRSNELNGDHYEILTPAADALAGKQPLAATILLRAMIDFSLKQSRSSRYRHAARHLAECLSLASAIKDFGEFDQHDAYIARLRAEHGRKSSFWSLVP